MAYSRNIMIESRRRMDGLMVGLVAAEAIRSACPISNLKSPFSSGFTPWPSRGNWEA